MKKLISFILAACIIFLVSNAIILPSDVQSEDKKDNVSHFHTASELSSRLESEDVDVSDADAYEISVLIELDDAASEERDFVAMNISTVSEDVDAELEAHRNRVKEYYVEYNESIASTLGLHDYEYYVSYYSPYIEIIFDDLDEYSSCESELMSAISNPELVLSASSNAIVHESSTEATIDTNLYSTNYLLSDAFEDIGVSDTLYTGNGVKVGIIDVGVPYTYNLISGKYTMLTSTQDIHSTIIASIIGGTSGIAENVHFYCMEAVSGLVDDCNFLIDYFDVNIINMSLRYASLGYYSNFDACIDNIVSNSGCTFVKSAGNGGASSTKYVTAPGCALNAITVGSINKSQNISYFSSWNVTDDFLLKPDVVAPGERLWDIPNIPNVINGVEGHSGTSYAAPMAVGTIALLMEEFPILKTNPALVKSVLHLGAEKLPSQTDYYDQQAGFGLLNYQTMRDCLTKAKYYDYTIPTTALAGDIIHSQTVTLSYLSQIFVHANTIVNSSIDNGNTTQATPVYTDYSIKIFDLSTSTYVATSTMDSNVDYVSFTNDNQSNSSFRIDIVLDENCAGSEIETGTVAYKIACDTHSFGSFVYYNSSSHIKYCSCGERIIGGHYIRQSDIVDGRYARCLGCRFRLDLLRDSANIVLSITQVSINGSYILQSGVAVLVDEDIDAYLDGTLVFYNPDDVPTTQ